LQRDTIIVYVSHDLGVVRNLVDRVAVIQRPLGQRRGRRPFPSPAIPIPDGSWRQSRASGSRGRSAGIPGSAVEPLNRPRVVICSRCEFGSNLRQRDASEVAGEDRTVRCWRWNDLNVSGVEPRSTPCRLWG
jgi:ABC-type dipeptide/oligopeptide/nickel transport system ATPase component